MDQAIVIKGTSKGYEIVINDQTDFDYSLSELNRMLQEVPNVTSEKKPDFIINTQNRLLTESQKNRISDILLKNSLILNSFVSNVVDVNYMDDLVQQNKTEIQTKVIRSGQEVYYDNDVIVLGDVHKGGAIFSKKNIYVFGKIEGIVHAGFSNDDKAIIVGDVSHASQVRISDVVEIVRDQNNKFKYNTYAYLDDLHSIVTKNVNEIKSLLNKGDI